MPRRLRHSTAGLVYHVLNRGAKRARLFDSTADYAAFEQLLAEATARVPMTVLAYCLMPNHWHLVLCPRQDGDLSRFMHWLTTTHAQRRHTFMGTSGLGPVYQGRFKAIPVQVDRHYVAACRYVEHNAERAGLVSNGQLWRWSSLWHRVNSCNPPWLSEWPLLLSGSCVEPSNQPQCLADLASIRAAIRRGAPYGDEQWRDCTSRTLGLESAVRPRGRPRKDSRPLFHPAEKTPDPFFTTRGRRNGACGGTGRLRSCARSPS